MQFINILIYFLIFGFNFIHLVGSPDPEGSGGLNGGNSQQESRKSSGNGKKVSIFSPTPKGGTSSLPSIASASISSSSRSRSELGFNIAGISTSNSIVLDFDASEISKDLSVSTTIPGILKYSASSNASGNFNKIKGNGKELNFTKKIDYVLCNSPFDNNVTVIFQDETIEEFYLDDTGFQQQKQEQHEEQEVQVVTPKPVVTEIELDLLNPSEQFSFEEIGNIKCYKPKEEGHIVSRIKLDNSLRILDSDIGENFVCYFEESDSYSIMVAYRGNENKWLKYTLSRKPSSIILMDVTLIRKFDSVIPEELFIDKSTPDDNTVFEYKSLVVNTNSTGIMKSKNTGNKVFVLTVTNSDKITTKHDIEFDKHFILLEGFRFYAIRSKEDYSEMIFSYINENVVLHEKYVKQENKYHKDLKTVYKHNIDRTKKYLDIRGTGERVVFMKSLVPDCIEQGLKLSHYGRFKVVDFEKSTVPTFLVFPNIEFYLKKDIDHRLILCENGRHISFIMNTETNSKRIKYIVGTDPLKGNPFTIMAKFENDNENDGSSSSNANGTLELAVTDPEVEI